jgi:hypothetical protein
MRWPSARFWKGVKKLFLISLAGVVIASFAAVALVHQYTSRQPPPPAPHTPLPDGLAVFCFHGKTRDQKSKNIEAYTHQILKKSFAVPLREGKIVWQVLCYEAPENARLKDEFQVTGPCIVLADGRSDRSEIVIKNLQNKVAKLADDKETFSAFIRSEIEASLK